MTVDPTIYGFISQPYRYAQSSDVNVQNDYEQARIVEVPGVFTDLTDAESVNSVLFDMIKAPRRRFTVEVDGTDVISLDDFDGETPCFTIKSNRYGLSAGLLVIAIGVQINASKNITSIDCWG